MISLAPSRPMAAGARRGDAHGLNVGAGRGRRSDSTSAQRVLRAASSGRESRRQISRSRTAHRARRAASRSPRRLRTRDAEMSERTTGEVDRPDAGWGSPRAARRPSWSTSTTCRTTWAGVRFFDEAADRTVVPGVATGLAVTGVGGDVCSSGDFDARRIGRRPHGHRPSWRRHEGVGADRPSYVRSKADALGIEPSAFEGKRSTSTSRRRHPQGRPVGQRPDDHRPGEPVADTPIRPPWR